MQDAKFFAGMVGILFSAVFIIGTLLYFAKVEQCKQQTVSFYAHDYGFFKGCMVKLDKERERWLPLKNFRVEVSL